MDRGFWRITVTYEDKHVEPGSCSGLSVLMDALVPFLGSEHGDIVDIRIVSADE